MPFDPKQVLAAFLTFSMFAMLGNMIKKDHIDPYLQEFKDDIYSNFETKWALKKVGPEFHHVSLPTATGGVQHDVIKVAERGVSEVAMVIKGPWLENSPPLKPCWNRPDPNAKGSKGFITFSLTIGPEYHLSQVTDAVVIARYLGASLLLPDIRGRELGQKRNFQNMYDLEKFTKSLEGVVKLVTELPSELKSEKPEIVRVPNRASEDFIAKNIVPIFRRKSYLRLVTSFPSLNLRVKDKQSNDMVSTSCLAMFGSLELKTEIKGVSDIMIERLRALSPKVEGKFVAVDLRVDVLEKKRCKENTEVNGRKSCYNVQEIVDFLKRGGFDRDTTVYLTQTWWHDSLNPLKENFPKTYTKDDIIPAEKKGVVLKSGSSELERAVDFQICTESDVFVPAISGIFYGNVAGKRIASGRTEILVPSSIVTTEVTDSISTFVTKKNHWAYSCYC